MKIGLGFIQILLLILWYTVIPTAPAWVIFLPLIWFGVLLLFGIVTIIGVLSTSVKVNKAMK